MKIILRSAAIAALVVLASCGKDDNGGSAGEMDEQAELLEQTPLEANTVADNVVIQGATKEEGTPPAPNGEMTIDISNAVSSAFLNEGFTIPVSSNMEIAGAYLQFESNDGTSANSYFNINISSGSSVKSQKEQQNEKTDNAYIDVGFNSNITPGTFCLVLSVYTQGNVISVEEKMCITVESWGGNSDILGKWNLSLEEKTSSGSFKSYAPGDERCIDNFSVSCESGGTVSGNKYCYTTNPSGVTFNEDGTFEYSSYDTNKEYNFQASENECEPVYDVYENEYDAKGKWAYLDKEDKFVLIVYEDRNFYKNELSSNTYAPGDGALLVEDEAGWRFESESLVFSVDDGPNDFYKAIFKK